MSLPTAAQVPPQIEVGIPDEIPAEFLEKFAPREFSKMIDWEAVRRRWLANHHLLIVEGEPDSKERL